MTAVLLAEAAEAIGKSEATLRRWIARGAPTVRLGGPGRAHGFLVDIADLRRWRAREVDKTAATNREFVERLATILRDYHRAGDHRLIGLRDHDARILYAALFEYVAGRFDVEGVEL